MDLLVNNAGFGLGTEFLDNSLENEINGLNVMVRAVMTGPPRRHLHALTRRGAILNVGSVASRTGACTYSAHASLGRRSLPRARRRAQGLGHHRHGRAPGPVDTPFFERAGVDMRATPSWLIASPEQVVAEALDAVRAGRAQVTH